MNVYFSTKVNNNNSNNNGRGHVEEGFYCTLPDLPQLSKGNIFLVVQLICHCLQPVTLNLLPGDDRTQRTFTLKSIKKCCIPETNGAPDGLLPEVRVQEFLGAILASWCES
ncbi:hypothetical protein E2C01_027066 [Portunus trituberculatus]|uniref:Uncharacterized protein n=1 Tax=Portunus trituberculatus TaxID=210409 RepID=A0A5B7EKD8_PORTR|nr:hypothetical protein [Portunus trituberculatus]